MGKEKSMKCRKCEKELTGFEKRCPYCDTEMVGATVSVEDFINQWKVEREDFVVPSLQLERLTEVGGMKTDKEEDEIEVSDSTIVKNRRRRNIKIVCAGLAIAACATVVILWWNARNKEYLGTDGVYYTKEDGAFLFQPETEAISMLAEGSMTDIYSYSTIQDKCIYSKDGKMMVFIAGKEEGSSTEGDRLYYKENYDGAKPVLITEDASGFTWVNDECLVYFSNSSLYYYDFHKATLLAENVRDYMINEDGTKLIYAMSTDDYSENYPYYLMDFEDLTRSETIGYSSYGEFICSDDFSEILYIEEGTLYLFKELEEKTMIASNIAQCYMQKGDEGNTIYYLANGDEVVSAYDFVKDIYLESDQKIIEKPVEGEDDYFERMEEYDKKVSRDLLREQLKDYTYDYLDRTLFSYKDGKTTVISENVTEYLTGWYYRAYEEKRNVPCIYIRLEEEVPTIIFDGSKGLNILTTTIDEHVFGSQTKVYMNVDGQEYCLGEEYSYNLNLDNQMVYYREAVDPTKEDSDYRIFGVSYEKGKEGDVFEVPIEQGEIYLDGQVGPYMIVCERSSTDDIATEGYVIKGEEIVAKIGDYVRYSFTQSQDKQSYFVVKKNGNKRDLYRFEEDGRETLIAKSISAFTALSKDKVLYISDYEEATQSGTLYYYNGSDEPIKVGDGVREIQGQSSFWDDILYKYYEDSQ